jgi:conserved oligomeric Golgi complex subunit 3
VQLFEPLPSQLAYPDILEKAREAKANPPSDSPPLSLSMSLTWYPPLRHTLALLSQLYGAVSSTVFEDLARRAVTLCIQALSHGAAGVRRCVCVDVCSYVYRCV